MQHKFKLIIILILVAVFAPALVPDLFEESQEEQPLVFERCVQGEVLEISISGTEYGDYILEKTVDANWRLAELPEELLTQERVLSLLGLIRTVRYSSHFALEDAAERSEYGLDKSNLRLEVLDDSGMRCRASVGSASEYLGAHYLEDLDNDNEVGVVESAFVQTVSRSAKDYRSRYPIQLPLDGIRSIEVSDPDGDIALFYTPDGMWHFDRFDGPPADKEAAEDLVMALRNLKVEKFMDDWDEERVAIHFRSRINIDYDEDEVLKNYTLSMTHLPNGRVNQVATSLMKIDGRKTIYEVAPLKLRNIEVGRDYYRTKRIVNTDPSDILTVEVRPGGETGLLIERQGVGYLVNGNAADDVFVEKFLKDLTTVETVGFPKVGPDYGFDEPVLAIDVTVSENGGYRKMTVLVGDQDQRELVTGYYVTHSGSDTVYFIREKKLARLQPREEVLLRVLEDEG